MVVIVIQNPSCINLVTTNRSTCFQNTVTIAIDISDFHNIVITVLRKTKNSICKVNSWKTIKILIRTNSQVFSKKGVLRNFAKFTGKHLCQRLFFNKVAGLSPVTLLRKRLWHRCFPVNLWHFKDLVFYKTLLEDCFCQERLVDDN